MDPNPKHRHSAIDSLTIPESIEPEKYGEPEQRRVILYSGGDPKTKDPTFYYLNLFWSLLTLGQEKKVKMIPLIDRRPENQRILRPALFDKILEDGAVDGIIGIKLYDKMTDWMQEAGVPFSAATGSSTTFVDMDYRQLITDSFHRLAELGCRSVGLMLPQYMTSADFLEHVAGVAESVNLEVKYEWILVSCKSQELRGYNHFSSLWELEQRPEGLVVFPDLVAHGVVSVILEKQIKVPEEIKLILHRNAESPYAVPLRCDWVENSTDDLAQALFQNMEALWAGKPMERIRIPFRLVKGA